MFVYCLFFRGFRVDSRPNRRQPKRSRPVNQSCDYCSATFTAKSKRNAHILDQHHELIFHCDVCTQYISRTELAVHMAAHAEAIEKAAAVVKIIPPSQRRVVAAESTDTFPCTFCTRSFHHAASRRYHVKTQHQRQRPFQCDECQTGFVTKRTLTNHMASRHAAPDSAAFGCDQCAKRFKTDSGLYAHRKVHQDSYAVQCQFCFKSFKFRSQLRRHATMHTKEKLYFCQFCQKGFGVRNNLTKHLRTHSNVMEFRCHICAYVGGQRRYLAEHMKNTHLTVLKK